MNDRPMTAEQAATLKRLAEAAYELEAFQPNLTRAEADLRIAMLTAKLKLLGAPPHTLWERRMTGRYFARTENVTAIDGSAPKFFTFIAFDNITKAKTFIDSIKATTALRTRVTKSRLFIVEGTMR
jgi:DUF3072 family protein